jgi:hypothetical protein
VQPHPLAACALCLARPRASRLARCYRDSYLCVLSATRVHGVHGVEGEGVLVHGVHGVEGEGVLVGGGSALRVCYVVLCWGHALCCYAHSLVGL